MPLPASACPVAVEPFRARFRHLVATGEIDAYELASRLGYWKITRGHRYPDTSRALRDIGLMSKCAGDGKWYTTEVISSAKALRLCEALHMDPVDADF